MSKAVVIYSQKYKKGSCKLRNDKLPDLNHLAEGFYASEVEILEAGVIEVNGVRQEYQTLRCILKERGTS
jgi:hypothetical protein